MRPSDSSRPFVISPFVLSDSRSSPSRSAEAERSPRVKTWNFPLHRRPYALPPTDIGLRLLTASSPKGRTPHDASLPFDAGFHLRLPPDLPSRARQGLSSGKDLVLQIDALVSSVLGSLRQGPMRTSTSCSTPMPGARFSRAPAALPETLRASAEGGQHGSGEPSIGRVARGGFPPPAPTEPDLWISHPALRGVGVRDRPVVRRQCFHTRSYPSSSSSWIGTGAMTRVRRSIHRCSSEVSPRSAKYAGGRARSTADR